MKLKLKRMTDGRVRVLDEAGRDVALIAPGRNVIKVTSRRLFGASATAGPFTKSVKFGSDRRVLPKIVIEFEI